MNSEFQLVTSNVKFATAAYPGVLSIRRPGVLPHRWNHVSVTFYHLIMHLAEQEKFNPGEEHSTLTPCSQGSSSDKALPRL